jgi:hypothetical protein
MVVLSVAVSGCAEDGTGVHSLHKEAERMSNLPMWRQLNTTVDSKTGSENKIKTNAFSTIFLFVLKERPAYVKFTFNVVCICHLNGLLLVPSVIYEITYLC